MKLFEGVPASPGIAIGKAYYYTEESFIIPHKDIPPTKIRNEKKRFDKALKRTKEELHKLQHSILNRIEKKFADIFSVHLLVLEDPVLLVDVNDYITEKHCNAEWAVYQVLDRQIKKLSMVEDGYFRERITDIHDIGKRVIRHLLQKEHKSLTSLTEQVIVIARNLSPSDTAAMRKDMVIGFSTDVGGRTSHTAIVARALGIPAVVGLGNITEHIDTDDIVIIDGNHGKVIINPDEQTIREYKTAKHIFERFEVELKKLKSLDAVTTDGHNVTLMGNIELPTEIETIIANGGRGVGLYRTEFLYLNRSDLPTEEELFKVFKNVVERMKPNPVIFRTIDIGGDKPNAAIMNMPKEANPFLGYRAIRYCLANVDVFETQLRAMIRASYYGNASLMIPMISNCNEIKRTKAIIRDVKEGLLTRSVPFNPDIEMGIMMEIPAAAMIADILGAEVDFFSIGTNDLVQYGIAVDRNNEKIAYLYNHFHPGVIRLLKQIIDGAQKNNIHVHMCGEMAASPLAIPLIVGMGLNTLSVSAIAIPEIKKIIRGLTLQECQKTVEVVMTMKTAVDIKRYLYRLLNDKFPDIVEKYVI